MSGVLPTKNGLLIPPIETPNNTLDDGSGNVSVNGNVTISGAGGVLTLNNTQDTTSLIINGNTSFGGRNQPASILLNNQASTITGGNKLYIRADATDNFQILNNDYSTSLLEVSQSGMVRSPKNVFDDGAGNATVAGALSANGIALAVTPSVITFATPPVSGTAYQWNGPGTLKLACPVTLSPTSTAAATASLSIGATNTLGTQMDYVSLPAGLTSADGETVTLKTDVPAGMFYGLNVTNATIGTCSAIAS